MFTIIFILITYRRRAQLYRRNNNYSSQITSRNVPSNHPQQPINAGSASSRQQSVILFPPSAATTQSNMDTLFPPPVSPQEQSRETISHIGVDNIGFSLPVNGSKNRADDEPPSYDLAINNDTSNSNPFYSDSSPPSYENATTPNTHNRF